MTSLVTTRRGGSGTPQVVFLHGLLGQGKNWATIADGVADQGPSLLLDLPHHGRSPWTGDLDHVTMADQVAATLRSTLPPATSIAVVGHSMGGKVAMVLALRHPDLVRGLVVVDIAPDDSSHGYGFARLIGALRDLDLAAVHRRSDADALLAASIPDPDTRGFLLQNLQRTPQGWRWRVNLDLIAERLPRISGWPVGVHGTYDGPTLWLRGSDSGYVRSEHAPVMRRFFPRALLVTIKGAGHWVHADRPEAVTAALRSFLTGLGPALRPGPA
ncbi:MAG: alpha/beta fold hydrolase [Propioniciclava sp.]